MKKLFSWYNNRRLWIQASLTHCGETEFTRTFIQTNHFCFLHECIKIRKTDTHAKRTIEGFWKCKWAQRLGTFESTIIMRKTLNPWSKNGSLMQFKRGILFFIDFFWCGSNEVYYSSMNLPVILNMNAMIFIQNDQMKTNKRTGTLFKQHFIH